MTIVLNQELDYPDQFTFKREQCSDFGKMYKLLIKTLKSSVESVKMSVQIKKKLNFVKSNNK